MAVSIGNLTVDIEQVEEKGKIWNVRLYKSAFLFKRQISSDWFLDEQQAQTFAKQLVEQLSNNVNLESIRTRKPGWTLIRPNP